jgi:hypothetical protein
MGMATVVVLSEFVWWFWWRLPKRQADKLRLTIRDPKARADVEDNIRKTIGQLLGGAAVLIGAGFAHGPVAFDPWRRGFCAVPPRGNRIGTRRQR